MTRWARAGSTQKHKKMPEDPTPWEEFAMQRKTLVKTEKKFLTNKVKKVSNEAASTSLKKKLKQQLKKTKRRGNHSESSVLIENAEYYDGKNDLNKTSQISKLDFTPSNLNSPGDSSDSFKEICSKKWKRKKTSEFPTEAGEGNIVLKSKKSKTGKAKFNKTATESSVLGENEKFCDDLSNVIVPFKIKKHKTGAKKFQDNVKGAFLSSDTTLINHKEHETVAGEGNIVLKSKKSKTDKAKFNKTATESSVLTENEKFCDDQSNLIVPFKIKKHKTGKKKFQDNVKGESLSSDTTLVNHEEHETVAGYDSPSGGEESAELSSHDTKSFLNRKKRKSFFEKVKEKRAKNGILLLPKEVENKLYRMKKALRGKGISEEQIKRMTREERRKGELRYRKTLKTCFNCRETGHVFANCPKVTQDNEQGTGICFKCGSTEHVSFRCHIKTSDFPFAKCFICHNTGHLSRSCPENKHGIYPKGGKCNLCGSIYHLRKDCPKSSKKKDGECAEITAHTINELNSVDDEIVEMESKTVKQKRPKVVKF